MFCRSISQQGLIVFGKLTKARIVGEIIAV
jgi:hypothetical protein